MAKSYSIGFSKQDATMLLGVTLTNIVQHETARIQV